MLKSPEGREPDKVMPRLEGAVFAALAPGSMACAHARGNGERPRAGVRGKILLPIAASRSEVECAVG